MIDTDFILNEAGLVGASAAGTGFALAGIAADLGDGLVEGHMIVDVSAIEIANNDELYKLALQGSTKEDFADTFEDLAILELGAAEVVGGDQDSTIGRYKVPFSNEKNGIIYPYVRVYCTVSGTITDGINYSCYLSK
jgi:hypothetical protein